MTNPAAIQTRLRADALAIFRATLAECSISAAFQRALHCEASTLHRLRTTASPATIPLIAVAPTEIDLRRFPRILIIALGKAAVPMLDALMDQLPANIHSTHDLRGVCAAPAFPAHPHPSIVCFAAGHPLPNADSFAAALAALDLLRSATAETLVFFLISGGGSALCELPLDPAISLEETRRFHQALVGCGAPIAELNAIRQAFSAVKGGRLAAAAAHATQYSLLVSDVPADALDALASGPTLPSSHTPAAVAALLEHYRLLPQFPPAVRSFFERLTRRATQPTPRAESQLDPARCFHDLLLSTDDLARSATRHAQALGYTVTVDNHCDDWDYAQAAPYLLTRLQPLSATAARACLISTGEVTVTLPVAPGSGGRNQQFALEAARLLSTEACATTVVLSAGTDGIDGISPAAGAIADAATFSRARAHELDPEAALDDCNAWPLFNALGDAVVTGPTGNNLRDLRLLLTAKESAE